MATNDVNLQVINSMTQQKMNSLKNSEGKIPELANQIIMTDDEDVNLSQFRTKVLWTNPNPSSSFGAQTITLSSDDYDYLVLIPTHNIANGIKAPLCVMPKGYGARLCSVDASSNSTYRPMVMARDVTSVSNTQLSVSVCRYNYGTTYTEERNDLLVPYQIIGLYKQPAMIYTGAELHEGNGIKIENGIIRTTALDLPSTTYQTLTLTSGNTYIAPANGWFAWLGSSTSASYSNITLKNTTNGIWYRDSQTANSAGTYGLFPVRKGDKVTVTISNVTVTGTSERFFRFYYAEGEV